MMDAIRIDGAVELLSQSTYHGQVGALAPTAVKQAGDGVLVVRGGGFVLAIFELSQVVPTAKAKKSWRPEVLQPPGWAKDGFGFLPTNLPLSVDFETLIRHLNENLVSPKGQVLRWFSALKEVALLQVGSAFQSAAAAPTVAMASAPVKAGSPPPPMVASALDTPPPAHAGDPTVKARAGSGGPTLPPLRSQGKDPTRAEV
ncbi:MAG: hypothetical protein WC675_04665 [Patescibacteria group bacterium]|jgi:hypothetical protein